MIKKHFYIVRGLLGIIMVSVSGVYNYFRNQFESFNTRTVATSMTSLPEELSGSTNIDRVIDDFQQGNKVDTGDCYFLAQLKNLSRKSWGKKMIKDAIQPDNNGGAYITFPGARGNNKTFHISVEELLNKRGNENLHEFSFGDDDALAVELAYLKYKKGLGYEGINGMDPLVAKSPKVSRNYINFPVDNNVVGLICGQDAKINLAANPYGTDRLFQQAGKDLDNYVIMIGFKPDNVCGLQGDHAYEVIEFTKDKKGHPMVVLGNPWDTSERITKNYYDVVNSVMSTAVWENPEVNSDWMKEEDSYYAYMPDDKKKALDDKQKFYHAEHERLCGADDVYSQLSDIIDNYEGSDRATRLTKYLTEYDDKSKLNKLLAEKSGDIIKKMDDAEWGWGKGKAKAELMQPLVEYVSSQAHSNNIALNDIANFEEACRKELNATFYTDEDEIIKAFDEILGKINGKENTKTVNEKPKTTPADNKQKKTSSIIIVPVKRGDKPKTAPKPEKKEPTADKGEYSNIGEIEITMSVKGKKSN